VQSHSYATVLNLDNGDLKDGLQKLKEEEYLAMDSQTLVEDAAPIRSSELYW